MAQPNGKPSYRAWFRSIHDHAETYALDEVVYTARDGALLEVAHDMGELVSAVMVLDYARIQNLAEAIATEPRLARPLAHDATDANAALPERFFELQDQLRGRAGELGSAAASQQAMRIAEAYGQLSQTCVECHATFRPGVR